jgi:hypothetical protein
VMRERGTLLEERRDQADEAVLCQREDRAAEEVSRPPDCSLPDPPPALPRGTTAPRRRPGQPVDPVTDRSSCLAMTRSKNAGRLRCWSTSP